MAYHLTIDAFSSDGLTISQIKEQVSALKPESILVDCAAPLGRPLLAALQAIGLPAKALEKRERPSLPEVQRVTAQQAEIATLKSELGALRTEVELLRAYHRDVSALIQNKYG